MKNIYIGKRPTKKRKVFLISLVVIVLLLLSAKFVLPPVLEAMINRSGGHEKGYSYKIKDLDIHFLKAEAAVRSLDVFNYKNDHTYFEGKNIVMGINPFKVLGDHKVLSLKADVVNATISKDLFDEVKRVKNESKENIKGKEGTAKNIYLDRISADVKKFNIRLLEEDKGRTLMTLNNFQVLVNDLGLGQPEKETEMKLTSEIEGGGQIVLHGKTKLEKGNTPWTFNGEMKNITPPIIEKLAGQKFPFEVIASNFNAAIKAHSAGGQIEGEISPMIKDLKLNADKEKDFLKRNIAKATNYLTDKLKGENEQYTITLPFTLNEKFKLDIEDSWNKFKKK